MIRAGALVRFCALTVGLVVFFALLPGGAAQEDVLPDPVPIKRVLIPAGQLPAELKKVRQGVLVSMPRPDFEALVQKAARAKLARNNPPRLIKAEYRAVLDGTTLTSGRGEWTVLNPNADAGILSLGTLNLALEKMKTKEDTEVVIGDLDGKTLGLVLEKAGTQPIFFDWTLRGIPGTNGVQFELKLPRCALNVLELTVPADQVVSASSSAAILSGPHESETPQQRKWRLHFAGRSQIDLTIRKKNGPGMAPLILSQVQSRQALSAGRCQADFDYRLEILHGSAEQLLFACDPGLEPYEVTSKMADIKSWEILKSKQPGEKSTLVVHLREPFQGVVTSLQVRCLAAMQGTGLWTSPGLHLLNGLERGETLTLILNPEVRLENWHPGQFRLLTTSNDDAGAQTLTLVNSGADKGPRPGGLVKTQGVDFLATQTAWWQIGPQGSTLTTDIALEIHRGKLFRLSCLLPPGWGVEAVALDPPENLGAWAVSGNSLAIDFQRGLTPPVKGTLHVRLASAAGRKVPPSGLVLDFPDVRIVEPCLRTGVLAIGVRAPYQSAILNASYAVGMEKPGPWKSTSPQFLFAFKNEPLTGKLRLVTYRSKVQARCLIEVVLLPGGATLQARLDVEPLQGHPTVLDMVVSGSLPEGVQWKSEDNQVVKMERMPLAETLPALLGLGAGRPLEWACLKALLPSGQRWRLMLAKPLDRKRRFNLQAMLKAPGSQPLEVPLVALLDSVMDGAVSLDLAGTELKQVKHTGLREDSEEGQKTRHFQYDRGRKGRFPRLLLSSQPKAEEKNDREICDHAEFTTLVDREGRMVHQFRFRVWNWRKSNFPLVLPEDAQQVLGARVDGRWLPRVPQQRLEGLHVLLAVPPEGNFHHFEIWYISEGGGLTWPGWTRLEAPAPKLPLAPLFLQRRWRLSPGLEPVEASFRCVTDPRQHGPVEAKLRQAWHAADSWMARLGASLADDWATPQRQIMAGGDVTTRRKLSKDSLVGEALRSLVVDSLGDQATLVVDTEAFATTGVTPATPLGGGKKFDIVPFWESAGLVYVPCPGGPLLTTRAKLECWNARDPHMPFADFFAGAVTEAVLHGQDHSGRFRTLDRWFATANGVDGNFPEELDAVSFPQITGNPFGWSEWQPRADGAHLDRMVVIQRRALNWTSLVLAVVAAFSAWRLGNWLSRSWFYRLLVIWLAAGVLALIWAPPVFRTAIALFSFPALLFVVLGYFRWLFRGRAHKLENGSRPAGIVAALMLLILAAAFLPRAIAGGPGTHVVLLVPGADGEPQTALVQPELLTKLDELSGRGASTRNQAVLTKARYQGTFKGSTAEFQAELECYNFAGKSTLFIPLDGVDLKDGAFLDGQPVFPVAVQAPQPGYALPLAAKGFHKLNLEFSVRLTGAGPNKELRFSIPQLAQSHLELTLPKTFQEVQAGNALGEQRLTPKGDMQTLHAQVGRENTVQVRWRSGSQGGTPAQVQVRELYFWDLRPSSSVLNAILEYSVQKGILPGVSLSLPEGLEVRTVEVGTSDVSKPSEVRQVPRLKTWRLEKNRTLHIDFQHPVASGAQVKLGLVPRFSLLPGNRDLALPFPLQVKQDGFLEGFLAYRLEDLEAQVSPQNLGVIGIRGEVFNKAWRVAEPRTPVTPTRAFSFRRNAPKAALGLTLVVPPPQASQEITWNVGPQFADWTMSCDLHSPANPLLLVEYQIPSGVQLAHVDGPHVGHWSRAGSLLQVWLTGPQKKTSVKLAGWAKNPQPLTGGKGRFDLPSLLLKNQAPVATTLHIVSVPGLTMKSFNLQNLTRTGEEEFSFSTQKPQANYGGSFLLAALPAQPEVAILTVAGVHNRALEFTSHLDCLAPHGELHQLTIQLDRWPADDINLEVLGFSAPRVDHKRLKDGHAWTVTLPLGIPRRFSCRLTGRRELAGNSQTVLPDVRVVGAKDTGRYLALAGTDFQGEPIQGLAPVSDVLTQLAKWPGEAKRLLQEGTAWQINRTDWSLQLKPRLIPVATGVQVLLAEQEAAVGDDARWIHQATFLLFAKAATDVHLALPEGSHLLVLAVDDQPISARHVTPERFSLPLPGVPGPHWLRLRWQFQKDEPLVHPNLACPTIRGIPLPPIQGTVFVPAGFAVVGTPPPADLMFHSAKAQLELSRLLGNFLTGKPKLPIEVDQKLSEAQTRFSWYCRQGEIQAARTGLPGGAWKDLRQKNSQLMAKLDREKIRLNAEKRVLDLGGQREQGEPIFSLANEGLPVSWHSIDQNQPRLVLTPHSEQSTHRALVVTEVLLLILVSLGILSCLSRTFAWLQKLWPEQLLLLAWLGCYFFDISALGLALMVIAISARIILVATWLQSLVHRPTPAGPGSSLHAAG
jgi:hypothetical protein